MKNIAGVKWFSRFVKTVCAERSIRYLNNFKIFCGRKHLFTRNERNINKKGQRLYLLNLSHVNSLPCSQIEIKTSVSAETHSGRQPAVSHRDHDVLAPFSDKPARDVSADPKTMAPDDSRKKHRVSATLCRNTSVDIAQTAELLCQPPTTSLPAEITATPAKYAGSTLCRNSPADACTPSSSSSSSVIISPFKSFPEPLQTQINRGIRLTPKVGPHPPTNYKQYGSPLHLTESDI